MLCQNSPIHFHQQLIPKPFPIDRTTWWKMLTTIHCLSNGGARLNRLSVNGINSRQALSTKDMVSPLWHVHAQTLSWKEKSNTGCPSEAQNDFSEVTERLRH